MLYGRLIRERPVRWELQKGKTEAIFNNTENKGGRADGAPLVNMLPETPTDLWEVGIVFKENVLIVFL